MSRFTIRAGGRRLRVRAVASTQLPALSVGTIPVAGGSVSLQTGGGAVGGVVYDVNSTDVIDVVLVGSDPGSHGLHVDHSHPARFFEDVTITAIADGNWSSTSTWDLGRVPTTGDVVRVPGRLTFSPAANRKLTCNLLVVNTDGELEIDFSGTANTCEVVFADTAIDTTLDPYQWGHGLILLGDTTLVGATKTPWKRLTHAVAIGQTTLTLASAPSGWLANDRLILPDTKVQFWDAFTPSSDDHYNNAAFEEPLVSSVASAVVTLNAATTKAHPGSDVNAAGTVDFFPAVGNLTRNVLFRSANPDGTRAHGLAHGRPAIDIRYCEFRDMGRSGVEPWNNSNGVTPGTNQQGRYGLHLHHCLGPAGLDAEVPQFRVEGCSFWNEYSGGTGPYPPRWAVTVHGTHYGLVKNNVCFNWGGGAIVGEDGSEYLNRIEGNFVVGLPATGTGENTRGPNDIAHAGQALWFANGLNEIVDNWVSSCDTGCSIVPYMANNPDIIRIPAYKGADPYSGDAADYDVVDIQYLPMEEFSGNEIGGRTTHGLTIWKMNSHGATSNPAATESVVLNHKSWGQYHSVYYNYMTGRLTFDGLTARGTMTRVRAGQGGATALFFSDYVADYFHLKNSDIQGFRCGWQVNFGTEPRATNNTMSNYIDFECLIPWGAGSDASAIPPRTLTLTNNVHVDPNCDDFEQYQGPRSKIYTKPVLHAYSTNLIGDDFLYVYDHDGVPGADYRIYGLRQDGSAVLPQTIESGVPGIRYLLGSPVAGQTNTYNLANHGVCAGNAITPVGAVTLSEVVGKAEAI